MTGAIAEAKAILSDLEIPGAAANIRQAIKLNLALVDQQLKNTDSAINLAREVIQIDKNSAHALQAKAIILEEREGDEFVPEGLLKLEETCRRRGVDTVANNLALSRLELKDVDVDEARRELARVYLTSLKNTDHYSAARAIIRLGEILEQSNHNVSDDVRLGLIDSYGYLAGERIAPLINRSHAVLWEVFERGGETSNLFRLFRHSSLFWRLRDDNKREDVYLDRLAQHDDARIAIAAALDRETAYYITRASRSQ